MIKSIKFNLNYFEIFGWKFGNYMAPHRTTMVPGAINNNNNYNKYLQAPIGLKVLINYKQKLF